MSIKTFMLSWLVEGAWAPKAPTPWIHPCIPYNYLFRMEYQINQRPLLFSPINHPLVLAFTFTLKFSVWLAGCHHIDSLCVHILWTKYYELKIIWINQCYWDDFFVLSACVVFHWNSLDPLLALLYTHQRNILGTDSCVLHLWLCTQSHTLL